MPTLPQATACIVISIVVLAPKWGLEVIALAEAVRRYRKRRRKRRKNGKRRRAPDPSGACPPVVYGKCYRLVATPTLDGFPRASAQGHGGSLLTR